MKRRPWKKVRNCKAYWYKEKKHLKTNKVEKTKQREIIEYE